MPLDPLVYHEAVQHVQQGVMEAFDALVRR